MRVPGSITPMVALTLFSLGSVDRLGAQTPGHMPDTKHGAIIAAQGTPRGAPPCAQCHAFSGESDGSGAFPRLHRTTGGRVTAVRTLAGRASTGRTATGRTAGRTSEGRIPATTQAKIARKRRGV